MTKSKKLPQQKAQIYSQFNRFQHSGSTKETDTTSITGTITSTHIFKK